MQYFNFLIRSLLKTPIHQPYKIICKPPHEAEFEELISYNYIEVVSQISRPEVYSVTKNGWNELKKITKLNQDKFTRRPAPQGKNG